MSDVIMEKNVSINLGINTKDACLITQKYFFDESERGIVETEITDTVSFKETYLSYLKYKKYEEYISELHNSSTYESFLYQGHCDICNSTQNFVMDYVYSYPENNINMLNWRERLICQNCLGNSRERFILSKLFDIYHTDDRICIVGENSFSINALKREDIKDVCVWKPEEDNSLTEAPSDEFDIVIAMDSFGIPRDTNVLFSELLRVMKKGAHLFFTVPFNGNDEITRGESNKVFGWDIIEMLKQEGFSDCKCKMYYGVNKGYMGYIPVYFEVVK